MTTHTAITDYYPGATLDNGSLLCHRTTDATIKTASVTEEINENGGVYFAVFADVAAGAYRLKLTAGGVVVATRDIIFAGTPDEVVETKQRVEGSTVFGPASTVERSPDNEEDITFEWPIATGTITVTRSINNADPFVSASGTAAFLRTVDGIHYWTLAYDSDDRPATEGTAQYRLVGSAGHTGLLVLRVSPGGDAEQSTLLAVNDRVGWLLAINAGSVSDPQSASSTYQITIDTTTYTAALAGQTDAGVRTAPTLSKA